MGTRELPASAQPDDSYSHSSLRLNDLDITSTIKAFQEGKKAHASKEYSNAIGYYTQALNYLKTDLESVILLHRAAAYEQQHECELVDKNAELAHTSNNNNSSDGHIVHENASLLDKEHSEDLQADQAGLTVVKDDNNDNQILLNYSMKIVKDF